jgi:ketosteroid isomerase-like protein
MFGVAGALACLGCGSSATDVTVIRAWARALTAGDVDRAASYFALPAIVQNGTPPVRITTREQAREFNQLLPCGARLVMNSRHGAYIYATFRLTNRVGGDCGAGTGGVAATAFLIRDGKIAEWRRLLNPGGGQQPPSTPTPSPGSGQSPTV